MTSSHYSAYRKNPIKNWEGLVEAENYFTNAKDTRWAFRGQDNLEDLSTPLERHCDSIHVKGADIAKLEVKMIRDFARLYHNYGGSAPPDKGNTLEWLSLMTHYGAPTRLVNFTYSFFIACYFALEPLNKKDKGAAVWAVNITALEKDTNEYILNKGGKEWKHYHEFELKRDKEAFRELFMASPRLQFVAPVNPLRLNERLTIQQGLFLAPGDVTATFIENLSSFKYHADHFTKIIIDPDCWLPALGRLYRIGITTAALFPGVEGFAKSLRMKALILHDLPPQRVETLKEI